jgi:hypothetical protein
MKNYSWRENYVGSSWGISALVFVRQCLFMIYLNNIFNGINFCQTKYSTFESKLHENIWNLNLSLYPAPVGCSESQLHKTISCLRKCLEASDKHRKFFDNNQLWKTYQGINSVVAKPTIIFAQILDKLCLWNWPLVQKICLSF